MGFFLELNAQDEKYGSKINLVFESGTSFVFSDYENSNPGYSLSFGSELRFNKKVLVFSHISAMLGYNKFEMNKNYLELPNSIIANTYYLKIEGGIDLLNIKNISTVAELSMAYHFMEFSKSRYSSLLERKNDSEAFSPFLNAGISANYQMNKQLAISISLGMNFNLNDNLDAVSIGSYNDYYYNLNFGLKYLFWAEIDSDGDGIFDDSDLCINKPEDLDGFEDEDGCPDLDNDNDGILDEFDLCANLPEDLDGFKDEDGCPDYDNDSDGILDSLDTCPNRGEDYDDFEDEDGCPEYDNDNDGINDTEDNCPDNEETFNGYLDEDGCPDQLPKELNDRSKQLESSKNASTTPKSFILHGDEFFTRNTYKIKNSSHSELLKIVEIMKNNPNILWRIEGHVEKYENRSEGIEESKNMAKAIVDFFINNGINQNKLQTVGLGDSFPISTNNTVFGRMKNRRVVIVNLN